MCQLGNNTQIVSLINTFVLRVYTYDSTPYNTDVFPFPT